MSDFLIVSQADDTEEARGLSAEILDLAHGHGMTVQNLSPKVWLGVRGPHAPSVLQVGGWALVGDVFNRDRPKLPRTSPTDPWDFERKLLARFWGRYVGVRMNSKRAADALLRDPSGALECITWAQNDLTFVCSTVEDWLLQRLRPAWRIDVEGLAGAMRSALSEVGRLMLEGPTALEPGGLQPLPATREAVTLWSPSAIAARSLGAAPPAEEAATGLRSAIDEAVAGFASLPGPLAVEVSGGLDSSIIASSVAHACPGDIRVWINVHGATPESDERPYVAALGRKLGFEPLCVPHATASITMEWLEGASSGFRPGLNALDRAHDLDWASRISQAGASALMTGRGGDSILYQNASADVFADLWRDRGWRALGSKDMAEIAASTEASMWTMARLARRRLREGYRTPVREHPIIAQAHADASHPWLDDCNDFGPGKAFHIAGVLDSVALHRPTAQSLTLDVRNPLCAQPVVEACLALATPVLTSGGRDRGLARLAFRDRLPPMILDRRSKGDMTRVYGRMILENLDVLRPWLIEGRLAALGVLDRVSAETELTAEALAWRGRYGVIMAAVALEGWVRSWERRLGQVERGHHRE